MNDSARRFRLVPIVTITFQKGGTLGVGETALSPGATVILGCAATIYWHSRSKGFLWLPMKRYLPYLIVGLVAVAMFGGGFVLYRAKKIIAPGHPQPP